MCLYFSWEQARDGCSGTLGRWTYKFVASSYIHAWDSSVGEQNPFPHHLEIGSTKRIPSQHVLRPGVWGLVR